MEQKDLVSDMLSVLSLCCRSTNALTSEMRHVAVIWKKRRLAPAVTIKTGMMLLISHSGLEKPFSPVLKQHDEKHGRHVSNNAICHVTNHRMHM
jgi:hypothetical protein